MYWQVNYISNAISTHTNYFYLEEYYLLTSFFFRDRYCFRNRTKLEEMRFEAISIELSVIVMII